MTNSRIQGTKRFSFWNEIYETVLSPYILLPTLFALINPKSGSFNVTDKGGAQEHGYFSMRLSVPFLVLLVLNLAGLGMAVPRYLYWDHGHTGTIAMNVFWALFNVVTLGVALAVCAEERQRRHSVRVACQVPLVLQAHGETVEGITTDLSTGGLAAKVEGSWPIGEQVVIQFPEEDDDEQLRGVVIGGNEGRLQIQFAEMSLPQEKLLTRVLYSRADRWLAWDESYATDHPLRSLLSVLGASLSGFWKLLFSRSHKGTPMTAGSLKPVRAVVISSVVLAVLMLVAWKAHASNTRSAKPAPPDVVERAFTLGSLASTKDDLLLEQPGSREVLRFATPQSWLIRGGRLELRYRIPKNAPEGYTYAELRLNDSALAPVTPTEEEREAGAGEVVVPLPPDLLTARNQLTIQLAGQGSAACALPDQKSPPWFRIDPASRVVLQAQPLVLASELASLPQPFLEHLANQPVTLPMVFAHVPDEPALESAGVLASWFGSLADDSGIRFGTRVGELPPGNAIVFLAGSESLGSEQMDAAPDGGQPSISLQVNPRDPYGKLLVVRGQTSNDLLAVAQALATGHLKMAGSSARLTEALSFLARAPNDAPRWIHDNRVSLDSLVPPAERRTSGQAPVTVYMHLAPDYNFGVLQNMYLHLAYAVESPELARSSNVAANLNGVWVSGMPLVAAAQPQTADISLADGPAAIYANTLELQFFFVPAGADPCAPVSGNSSAQILKSSYLDLNGAVHYTELPNLQLFAKAGFPFTRMADLSETAVLLPAGAPPEATALYLDLMGYFGAQTGYPALGVIVASAAQASQVGKKDLLVLGTFADLANSPEIAAHLPLTYSDGSPGLSLRARLGLLADWVLRQNPGAWKDLNDTTRVNPDGLVEGIASPFAGGRSLVLIAGRDRAVLPGLASALLTTMPLEGIDGTVSLWSTGKFTSYPLSTAMYGSGDLPWYRAFGYWLPRHVFSLTLLLFIVLALLAAWTKHWLGMRIKERLGLEPLSGGSQDRDGARPVGEAPLHTAG